MSPDILADENIDARIIEYLRRKGFNVTSVKDVYQGYSDREILTVAAASDSLIITEDKDFGELIFSFHEQSIGVILLRYHFTERIQIAEAIVHVIRKYQSELLKKFTVITPRKIRMRDI